MTITRQIALVSTPRASCCPYHACPSLEHVGPVLPEETGAAALEAGDAGAALCRRGPTAMGTFLGMERR